MYAALLKDGLSARTVGHAHRVLGRALREAEIAGLVGRNVARLVRPPCVPHSEMRTLTSRPSKALLKAAKGDRVGALYHVALASGAREGELLALRWVDVNQDLGTISIARTLVRTRKGLQFAEPKTAAGRRTIPMGGNAIAALQEHKVTQAMERKRDALSEVTDADLVRASEAVTESTRRICSQTASIRCSGVPSSPASLCTRPRVTPVRP